MKTPTILEAENLMNEAEKLNPGAWIGHSKIAAFCSKAIAEHCDNLGFIYEYLISNFAANAGKKAGEFYTPHEGSLLMSEIVADHLSDRDKIEIYESKVQSMIQFSDCLTA